jgi:transglutaminase-like putative cysteine protease
VHFAIQYVTEYRYDAPVTDNLNALRVTPATTPTQRVDQFSLRLDPEARTNRHKDYFGTEVIEFGVPQPHDHLTIDVRTRVTTTDRPAVEEGPWSGLNSPAYRRLGAEFLLHEIPAPSNGVLGELVEGARATTPLASVLLLAELIRDRFEYRQGVTYVGSTVQDLLDVGAGVCQDFAHLGIVVLRRMGIAARYVSGYLFAPREDDDGESSLSAEVDTHAWLEALVPPPESDPDGEPRWVGADPTNGGLAGERHVIIGHGRHYPDVPPIKGVYRGTASATLESWVKMTRTEPESATRA